VSNARSKNAVRNETLDEIHFETCPPITSSNHDMSSDMSGDRTNETGVSHFILRLVSLWFFDLAFVTQIGFASHPLKIPGKTSYLYCYFICPVLSNRHLLL
jgi:hypothetical protein